MKIGADFEGLYVTGKLVVGDWEGDPSIPGGKREIPPYIDDLAVKVQGFDHTSHLTPRYLEHLEERVIRALSERSPL